MAAGATPVPAPPGGGPPGASDSTPVAASPASPQPNPQLEQGSRLVIQAVQALRAIAQAFPAAAPMIREINDKMREVQLKMMANAQPGEPSAPPQGG